MERRHCPVWQFGCSDLNRLQSPLCSGGRDWSSMSWDGGCRVLPQPYSPDPRLPRNLLPSADEPKWLQPDAAVDCAICGRTSRLYPAKSQGDRKLLGNEARVERLL